MKKRKLFSPLLFLALPLFILTELLLGIAKRNTSFADLINNGASQWVRRLMATLTSPVSFSIFEILVMLIPLIAVLIIIVSIRRFRSGHGRVRFISALLSVVLILLSGNTLCLGFGYRGMSLRERLSLESEEVTEDRLADTMILLRDKVNNLSVKVEHNGDGTSIGHSLDRTSELLCDSFDNISAEYGFFENFDSRVKLVKNGWAMSMLGITGIYTYYTGESNVNTAFPVSELTFVAAHELSHQRGIMRENEANFMAFLVTVNSDDTYLQYSGYLSMYQYIASALYRTNPDRYFEIARDLAEVPRADINASNAVIEKYGDTFIADISELINDLFLKSNGTAGVVTYGEVVKLAISYYVKEGSID
jgi:hypothetical protein